jgi:hypothetical protein
MFFFSQYDICTNCYTVKLERHTGISLVDNFFSEFQIHKKKRTLNQLRKIRVPDSAPDPELAPDPEQALDLESTPEGPRSSDHLRKIKVPDPAPELALAPQIAPDTELALDPELAPSPDLTIIWLKLL